LTIAFADEITFSWSIFLAQEFHPFHPIGGVSAMASPIFILNSLLVSPDLFFAFQVTR
jgi:hypothetical protein